MMNNIVGICERAALQMRRDIVRMGLKAGPSGAHLGGALSAVEILATLYLGVLRIPKRDCSFEARDRFILSKGHCVMAQYAAMRQAGILAEADLETFENGDSDLCSHATMKVPLGIEFSTGSLGQGLSMGLGTALALRHSNNDDSRVIVLLGDGECDEGQVWEAAMCAAHYNLANMIAIVDMNGMQLDGTTENILQLGNLAEKWRAFGWTTQELDGHNISALLRAFEEKPDKPLAIIAHTVKGRGISFMEHATAWHHGRLGKKQYEQALAELEGQR